ncbi:hypothetical protein QS306_03885 [Paraburkholderia bonniea]|uniref:phosphodiesterase n=1 Tax=Paraburkholderia bonniea TaxID=2152891 RepID=UPI00129243FF|nr:phosphodiesterase [Paraburkholderia bonniea]WJF90816.1 hypothetical protein QS306_03885 [Paraburkholderia bonniea]WJF94130.1 hypothetical protein QS308_03885 [Paraburkholderia bonniea]
MKVLSHRGYWKVAQEKNTPEAFIRSVDLGFGTETDIRDVLGELVISHDPPRGGQMSCADLIAQFEQQQLPLALNVKADGLAEQIRDAFSGTGIDWFVFDMSVPDMKMHIKAGNPVFTRMSEVEQYPAWIDNADGVWLDSFGPEWYTAVDVRALLQRGLRVCIVSPELHGRCHTEFWSSLYSLKNEEGLMICTDFPEECRDFFKTQEA